MSNETDELFEDPALRSRRRFLGASGAALTAAVGLAAPAVRAAESTTSAQERVGTAESAAEEKPIAEPPAIQWREAEGSGGAVLVEQLRALGIRYVFHTNTSALETVFDAIVDTDVEVISLPDEGLAVAAAQGYAMASGQLGFFIGSQVGVGRTISNLCNAWKDHTPILVSFARSSLSSQGGQNAFEEWDDHLKPTEPFTAWRWSCVHAATIPDIVRRAARRAFEPPGWPVALDFPYDLLTEQVRARVVTLDSSSLKPSLHASSTDIDLAARWLTQARNPIFIVGPDISREAANQAVVELAERLSVPVFQADDLFCDFPTHHPLFLGDYAMPLRFPKDVDLVVNFGAEMGPAVPTGARVIHVNANAESVGRRQTPDLPIVASVRTVIADLIVALSGPLAQGRLERIRIDRLVQVATFTRKLREARESVVKARWEADPISWERLGRELDRALDEDAILVPELGSQRQKLLWSMRQGLGSRLRIGRTEGSALGWGVPAALGVQLANPASQVVALQGDGGFMFGQTETLWSLSRYDAPILIVVLNNHSYNETRNRNLSFGGRQFQLGKDLTSYMGNPDVDFTRIAAAYEIAGEKVRAPGELKSALQRALRTMKDGRPFLLDVEVERDGMFAASTWHPPFSIAALREGRARSG